MKSFKATWFFVIIVLGLACYTYFFEYRKGLEKEQQKAEESKVFQLQAENVVAIEVEGKEGKIRLVRGAEADPKSSKWLLTEPINDQANEFTVDEFVKQLLEEKQESVVAEGDDKQNLQMFGFEPPQGVINVKYKESNGATEEKNITVLVGTRKNFSGKNYLKRSDDKQIYLASAAWSGRFDKKPKDFRAKTVLRHKASEITAVDLNSADKQKISLVKADGKWDLSKKGVIIDTSAVESFVASIANLDASDFVSEKKSDVKEQKKYGLQQPLATVKLKLEDGSQVEARAGKVKEKDAEKYYVVVDSRDTIFEISKPDFDAVFKKDIFDLRDKGTPFKFDKIKGSVLRLSGFAPHEFGKDGEAWKLKNQKPDVEAENDEVKHFVDGLADLKVVQFLGANPKLAKNFKMTAPKNKVVINDSDGKLVFELAWGDEVSQKIGDSEKKVFAGKTNLSDEFFYLETSSIKALTDKKLVKKVIKQENPLDKITELGATKENTKVDEADKEQPKSAAPEANENPSGDK